MATFYYRIRYGIEEATLEIGEQNELREKLRKWDPSSDPRFWWTGILWGTGACAIHNIQQMKSTLFDDGQDLTPLSIDEDPIAYLGILVDCLQEWDRYSVNPAGIVQGLFPLQGIDVKMTLDGETTVLNIGDEDRAKKVTRDLNTSLIGWEELVRVEF